MRVRILDLWSQIRSSLWFVPGVMSAGAIVLAVGIVEFESSIDPSRLYEIRWLSTGAAAGARAILSTIAGSMITVAGVTFSVTVVALSLASSQFGPRLLRNFMRDRVNQTVLGMFISTFLYCAVVLRAVHTSQDGDRVPYLAVSMAVVLALVSLGGLIFFIHHVALSIQADQVIAFVSADLDRTIEQLFPDPEKRDPACKRTGGEVDALGEDAAEIMVEKTGYLRALATNDLMEIARSKNLCIEVLVRPRDFLMWGAAAARAKPADRLDDEARGQIHDALITGRVRTPEQDVEFCVNQLVELALRALSTGINDPGTAMLCVDRLSAAIARLGRRDMPARLRYDETGELRLILEQPTFDGVADAAFHQIRQHARGNVAVTIRLLEGILKCLEQLRNRPERCATLLRHAQLVINGAREAVKDPSDLRDVERRYQRIESVRIAERSADGR